MRDTARPEGLVLVDKPADVTSHDVVDAARRAYGERSIGHLGTLDPFATGLLIVLVGRATRLANFIDDEPKVYRAVIRFGSETDTDDSTGTPTINADLPTVAAAREAAARLTGNLDQTPPAYSAKKVDGERAYEAARRGEALDLPPVRVRVHSWEVIEASPDTMIALVTCAGGTYVRALARDLGRLAGSAAHLESLRRERAGEFSVTDACPLSVLASTPPPLRRLRVVADA